MITSFGNSYTEKIWEGIRVKGLPPEIQEVGRRKLRMINNSINLLDLRIPPSNRLEKLSGEFEKLLQYKNQRSMENDFQMAAK